MSEFFPQRPEQNPTIYAYKIIDAKNREGLLKVGFTSRNAQERIKEQLGTSGLEYKIVLELSAIKNGGIKTKNEWVHSTKMLV
ncbi:GIY-YIG nuclease family protein [Sulfurimonas sp. SAG-AH-194-L11]|nr:hypothetical protein [Sulfurimonas sp. SAG-AH-194-L11]MDF1877664.1 GIY-YIG nuclease family protein [Sulfurimonas sp. SAG-AH-194-L11]